MNLKTKQLEKLNYLILNNRFYLIIEIALITSFLYIIIFNIVIFPLNLFLGILCVLFLPGYNLLNLIKPNFNFIAKLGYTTVVSLAIENLLMLFSYIILYDLVTTPEDRRFFFNETLLICATQIINLLIILLLELKRVYKKKAYKGKLINDKAKLEIFNNSVKKNSPFKNHLKNININKKILLIFFCFAISLIFTAITAYYSDISDNEFSVVHEDYRSNFTFFYRVPLIFFIFLTISILSLIGIIFYSKNEYLILISISVFLYCLWILPYLQINNYFGIDSYKLMVRVQNYQIHGIKPSSTSSFSINKQNFRYSASIFTTIILKSATGVDINFALWYLYPLIFIFSPFFFYSIFQKFLNKSENNKKSLIMITILAILNTQIIKLAHSATTMVLSFYIFLILVMEFYNFIYKMEFNIQITDLFLFILLFLFLSITHFEECIYIFIIIVMCTFYFIFTYIKRNRLFEISKNKYLIRDNVSKSNYKHVKGLHDSIESEKILKIHEKHLKRTLFLNGFILWFFLMVLYLTIEFFGAMSYYFFKSVGKYSSFKIYYDLYLNSKINCYFILGGSFSISFLMLIVIFLIPTLFIIICYLFFFKFFQRSLKLFYIFQNFLQIFLKIIRKTISKRLFQLFIIPIFFVIVVLIDLMYYQFLQELGLFLLMELLLNYSIIVFQLFLILKGILYYEIENEKQNYFLICIIASSSILFLFLITNNILLAYYTFGSRFLPILIVFNLIIIQNNYFEQLMKKKKEYLILLLIILLFLGTIYSLNKIGWE